jgi:hypothetical protein
MVRKSFTEKKRKEKEKRKRKKKSEFRSTQEIARQNIQVAFYIRLTGL